MLSNRSRSAGRHATDEQKAVLAQERMGRAYLAKLHPGKFPRREHSSYMRVAVYLCALAWRVFNDRHLAGLELPAQAELEAALGLYLERYLVKFLETHDDPTSKRPAFHRFRFIDPDQADHLARSLSAALLRDWSPGWIEERQRRGRAGGKGHAPRRPTKATPENLARLVGLGGLTKAQQAAELGVSVETVKRMRRALRESHSAVKHPPFTRAQERAFDREIRAEREEAFRKVAEAEQALRDQERQERAELEAARERYQLQGYTSHPRPELDDLLPTGDEHAA